MSDQHTWNGDERRKGERRKGERRKQKENYEQLSNQLNTINDELTQISNDIRDMNKRMGDWK
jgi:archaellum component FlaC